jgi:DNA primase
MGLIPEDKIAEIRDRTDIIAVIGEYVSLKRAGTSWKGLCPFHNEKSPSFNVHPVRQFFHCFGCGKSGDVFTFLRELEGKSFLDTARELARRAGIDLPEPTRSPEADARAQRAQNEREKLLRVNELTADFYARELAAPGGAPARAYLERRGIAGRMRKEGAEEKLVTDVFRVGYAPAGWDALTRFLESKSVPHELAERAGLIRQRDRLTDAQRPAAGAPPNKTTHFDVFVDRVVYALTSPVGEVLGFGGRVLADVEGQPKYKNSPETLLYKKGENLFGLHAARHQIRRTGRALVVEGNFDVMTLHALGVGYAVAPQGTAITTEQVKLLSRFAREVVLMLDADPAGRAATLRVIHLFVEAGLPCKIATLRAETDAEGKPKKVDPDELARRDLPRLISLIEQAPDAVEHYLREIASVAEASVPGRVRAIGECVTLLRVVPDRLARELYCETLAQLLNVPTAKIVQAMREAQDPRVVRARPEAAPAPEPAIIVEEIVEAAPAPPRPLSLTHQKLVSLLVQHPVLLARLTPETLASISDPDVRALIEGGIARRALDGRSVEEAAPAIRQSAAKALLSDEFAGLPQPEKALSSILAQLSIPRDPAGLEAARKAALESGDRELVQTINARILARRRA